MNPLFVLIVASVVLVANMLLPGTASTLSIPALIFPIVTIGAWLQPFYLISLALTFVAIRSPLRPRS